jgi:hypothetical protein
MLDSFLISWATKHITYLIINETCNGKKQIKNNQFNSSTYLKEVNNWDHSALGTAQPSKMMKTKLSTGLYLFQPDLL